MRLRHLGGVMEQPLSCNSHAKYKLPSRAPRLHLGELGARSFYMTRGVTVG
jgi:hypothetical protein